MNDSQSLTYEQMAVNTIKKNGGCGKMFPKGERYGERISQHACTCGFNKWNYLCPECEAKKDARLEKNDEN